MSDVSKKRKVRGGHRAFVKRYIGETNEMIANYEDGESNTIVQRKITLTEKLETVKHLGNEILDLITEGEDIELQIENEIEESESVRAEIQKVILTIEETLDRKINKQDSNPHVASTSSVSTTPSPPVRAKLPRLEVRKFSGEINEWDSFESAIHKNESLADLDKFSYLRGFLIEPARSTIAGFALTSRNYQAAIDLLKRRYGKKTAIQRAHVNDLLNVEPVYHERDPTRIRRLYNLVESKYRALEALEVDQATYSTFVVPSLLGKLPESLRLMITRGEDHHSWDMSFWTLLEKKST